MALPECFEPDTERACSRDWYNKFIIHITIHTIILDESKRGYRFWDFPSLYKVLASYDQTHNESIIQGLDHRSYVDNVAKLYQLHACASIPAWISRHTRNATDVPSKSQGSCKPLQGTCRKTPEKPENELGPGNYPCKLDVFVVFFATWTCGTLIEKGLKFYSWVQLVWCFRAILSLFWNSSMGHPWFIMIYPYKWSDWTFV